jgi:sugar/nucleoside kinase (ribokinase family)
MKTTFIGKIGDDIFGRFVTAQFEKDGVGVYSLVKDRNVQSKFACVMVNTSTGERTIISSPNEAIWLYSSEVDLDLILDARHILLDTTQSDAARTAAETAVKSNITTSIDAGSESSRFKDFPDNITIFLASPSFFDKNDDNLSLEDVKSFYKLHHFEIVLATAGPNGSYLVDKNYAEHIKPQKIQALDVNGAGDAYHGAFVFGYLSGWDTLKSAKFASCVAAEKCKKFGARASIPDYSTILREAGYLER